MRRNSQVQKRRRWLGILSLFDRAPASSRRRWFSGDPAERAVGLLIAIVTLIAAFVAYLDSDASNRYTLAMRETQLFAIQAMGERARGEILAGYAWTDAYRSWLELDTQAVLSTTDNDKVATERLTTVRNEIATLTPLLQPPYFDPASQDRPNLRAYEADLYIAETSALVEHFMNAYRIADGWGEKSGAYLIHLTLLTVSLFLFGLATTVPGRMTWLFIGLGSLLSLFTLVWMIDVVRTPVSAYPKAAISAFAQGVGLAHQQRHAEAVAAFSQAIELEPEYIDAYYWRANAHASLEQFSQAANDYQAAIDTGRQDRNVYWNLGWSYYRLGDYDQAVTNTDLALEQDPEQVALHFNRGLAQLAAGDLAAAEASYTAGSEMVNDTVIEMRQQGLEPPVSLWWYLDTAVTDLHNLFVCASDEVCAGAPPATALSQPAQSAELAQNWQRKLQTLSVSLEYSDQISQTTTVAQGLPTLGELSFTRGVYDGNGQLVSYTSLGQEGGPLRFGMVQENEGEAMDTSIARAGTTLNRDIFVNFHYQDMQPGQLLVLKVFLDEREASGLRVVSKWSLGTVGDAILPLTPGRTFTLAAGNYRIEVYLDGQLVQTGTFEIAS